MKKIPTFEELSARPIEDLCAIYQQLFKTKEVTAQNPAYIARKIFYKLQMKQDGGLSPEAEKELNTLIIQYDPINNKTLRSKTSDSQKSQWDSRLPIPGSVITKIYKGKTYQVNVLEHGFEYEGKRYKTLSRIARVIAGTHWNGFLFFGL